MLPDEIFARTYSTQDFDITELSASSHIIACARGDSPYVAVPIFVSRTFRHSAFYIRTDRGIESPSDLRGKLIGVPQYQQTAALWARGILADEFGVCPQDVAWRSGGLNEAGSSERIAVIPKGIDLGQIPAGSTLSTMLANGVLDAVIASRPPRCFEDRTPNVRRLFHDSRADEEAYFQKTRLFPIMHLVGIRRTLVADHPWLPEAVFEAFEQARLLALRQLRYAGAYYATLPWLPDELARTEAVMGRDFWTYGVKGNRHEIEAMLRWSEEQGLIAKPLRLDELFASSCLDT